MSDLPPDALGLALAATFMLTNDGIASRIRAMGAAPAPAPPPDAPAPPPPAPFGPPPPVAAPAPGGMPLTEELFEGFNNIMWGVELEPSDIARWFSQGFRFRCVCVEMGEMGGGDARVCSIASVLLAKWPGYEVASVRVGVGVCE